MTDHAPPSLTIEEAMARLPADFAFFAERWRSELQPALAAREGARVAALRRKKFWTFGAVAAALLITGLGLTIVLTGYVPVIAFLVGAGIYGWGARDLAQLRVQTKEALVRPVAAQFGMTYEMKPVARPASLGGLQALGLIPDFHRAKIEDRLTGARNDAPFEFYEAHLEQKHESRDSNGNRSTSWVTVFRGQCLSAKFFKQFNGVTKVFRDAGVFNALMKMGQHEQSVRLEDPRFEKAFEVYGSDQIESRYLLTPDFMERLLALETQFEGRRLRCAFAGGEMMLAIEGKNLLEPGSMERRLDDPERVNEMLSDFAAIFLLLDAMSAQSTPLGLRNPTH